MLIILEGCDGTGKSTLAENISKIIRAEIIHHSKPLSVSEVKSIIDLSANEDIIVDRFHLGQYVYNEPEDRLLSEKDMEFFKKLLKITKSIFIYVTADNKDIAKRLSERSECCNIEVIKANYESALDRYIDNYIEWNTSTGGTRYVNKG